MVTGISGVGKTHLLMPLAGDDHSLSVFQFGTEMKAAVTGLTGKDDVELSELPLEDRQSVQSRVSRKIATLAEEKPVIIDGHLLVEQSDTGFRVPGLPAEEFKELKLSAIVLITDRCERILSRRLSADKYAARRNEVGFLKSFQEDVKRACVTYSILFGCFLVYFDLSTYLDLDSDSSWSEQRSALADEIRAVLAEL